MTLVAPSPSFAQIGRPSDGSLIYVRDQIVVNDALTTELKAQIAHRGVEPGGRLTLIAREIVHEPKYVLRLEGFPLLLVADTYNANGGAVDTSGRAGANGAPGGIGKQGLAAQNTRHDGGDGGDGAAGSTGTAAVPLTLIARTIIDAGLVARGGAGGSGGAGGRGGAGGDGRHGVPGRFEGFEGTDGGQGGNGGRGGAGGAAARITIHYLTAHQPLRLDGRGGSAGAGGPAGAGGAGGKILGKAGPAGTTGTKGATGASVLPAPHPQGEPSWWKTVLDTAGASAARRWAEHRTRMGEYLFRTGDRAKALVEFQAAMRLAPDHAAEARRFAQYITANQTPLGISYDHDLILDFRHYEDVVTDYGPMIQELLSVATTMLLEASDVSANRERLEGERQRLEHLQVALVTDIVGANAGLSHAEGEVELADTRIRQLENQITALEKAMRQEQMDDFDVLGTLWDVAVAVVAVAGAIYTGGATLGALASAAGLLANAENVLHSGLWDEQTGTFDGSYLLEFKKTKAYKDMVGGFEELVQQGKSFYDKAKVIGGLFDAKVGGERTNEHKDLVQQLAELTFERNLLELTRMQADLALEAASQRKQAANEDNAFLSAQIDALGSDVATLARVAHRLITSAQTYVDLYTRYAFFSARALELWTVRPRTAGYSFALGYLHPDREAHAFAAAERGQARRLLALLEEYVPSISDLPSPLHLRDAYETYTSELNTFRQYWNITDATVLDELRQHGRTSVRIPLDTIGANRIELKIEHVYLSLVGAAAMNDTVMVEVEHSGHASNRRRTRGEVVISDTIAPPRRSTVAASLDESLVEIEDQQQFWGRSPAALWRLAVDPTRSPGLDLSGMNELQIVIDYRYVPIG